MRMWTFALEQVSSSRQLTPSRKPRLPAKRGVSYLLLLLIILAVLTVGVLYNYFTSILAGTFFILLFLVVISILIFETVILGKATNQSSDDLNDITNNQIVESNTQVEDFLMDLPSYDSVIPTPSSSDAAPPPYSSTISTINKATVVSKSPSDTCSRLDDNAMCDKKKLNFEKAVLDE